MRILKKDLYLAIKEYKEDWKKRFSNAAKLKKADFHSKVTEIIIFIKFNS